MRPRLLVTILAGAMLPGCQPPTYEILAVAQAGVVILVGVDTRSSWGNDGINADSIEVRDRDRILWSIHHDFEDPACVNRAAPPMYPYPLVYGRVPRCFVARIAAQPLRDEILYRVTATGVRDADSYFRLGRTARNYSWDDPEADTRGWREISDARFAPAEGAQVNASANAAAAPAESNATSR